MPPCCLIATVCRSPCGRTSRSKPFTFSVGTLHRKDLRLGGKAAAGLLILTWCLLDVNAGEAIVILAKNTPIWLGDEHPNALIFRHAECGRLRAIDM